MMRRRQYLHIQPYGIAILSVLLAVLLTHVFRQQFHPAFYPFFLGAVMISSWYGGLGAGLLATAVGTVLSEYFFLPPLYSIWISWSNLGRMSHFIVVSLVICYLNMNLRIARHRAETQTIVAQNNQKLLMQSQDSLHYVLQQEQAARAEAEAANRLKDEFLAMLSHELRTPLTAILGWVGMLQSHLLDRSNTELALETINRNATLQMQLIEDLLDVSRITQGKMRLNCDRVNLTEVIHAAIEVVQPMAKTKRIQLKVCSNVPGEMYVWGDVDRLQQVGWNLLSNAVKFTPEDQQVVIKLSMTSMQRDTGRLEKYAQVQVRDPGIGISADFLPYVFDRFRQADSTSTRSYKGLGLGLAIARHLVELHGGTIQAESSGAGQGSTFTVTLPLLSLEGGAAGKALGGGQ